MAGDREGERKPPARRRLQPKLRGPFLLLAGLMIAGLDAATPAAEPTRDRGRELFLAACATCHTPGQGVVTGPDLTGLMGRKAGSVPGFHYSRALRNSRIVWSAATMDTFLENPQGAIPGNTMPYPGLPDAKERAELIAYLQTLK